MNWSPDPQSLRGRVAVVTGATRGAGRGIALALGEAGATVICTGRSTRALGSSRSDYDRPETIEETAELVTRLGGNGIAVVDVQSGATGEIANVDRTFDVCLHEELHPPESGWRQAASLMASPRGSRLVHPVSKVGDMPLLHVPRGSKDLYDQREFFLRECGEHRSTPLPQRLPDAIDPCTRVWRQFNLWSTRPAERRA